MKKDNRGFSVLSLATLAVLFLAVAPMRAQDVATQAAVTEPAAVSVTDSESTIQVTGSATASRTGETKTETVAFSGNVAIHASVVTDPALPTGVTLFIDGKSLRGAGSESGTAYITSCEAYVTRLFRPKDTVTVTFAFFEEKAESFLDAKTGSVTINLTYDETSRTLTGATGVVGTVDGTTTTSTR
jgi:hypothetical protein